MKLTEKIRVQVQRNRARKLGSIATLTLAEWEKTIVDFQGKCAYCQIRPFIAIEHFIPFGQVGDGTYVNNCLPACQPCNNLKQDHPLEVFTQKLGKETIERLQTYLANRTPLPDEPASRAKRPRRPEPTSAEERRKIRLIGGIHGREPRHGDEIELQGEHGIIHRKVDWVTCEYIHYNNTPNDYDVWLLPYRE